MQEVHISPLNKTGDLIPICLLLHLEAGIKETFIVGTFGYKPSSSLVYGIFRDYQKSQTYALRGRNSD